MDKNIIKIKNNSDKDFSFVPYGQNFRYTIKSGDMLEFRVKNNQQSLYYQKLLEKDVDVELIEHYVLDPLVLGETYEKIGLNIWLTREEINSLIEEFVGQTVLAQGNESGYTPFAYISKIGNSFGIRCLYGYNFYDPNTGFENVDADGRFLFSYSYKWVIYPLYMPNDAYTKLNGTLFGNGVLLEKGTQFRISGVVKNGLEIRDELANKYSQKHIAIIPQDGSYGKPDVVTVNGVTGTSGTVGCIWEYNKDTGYIDIENVSTNIDIYAECIKILPMIPFAIGQGPRYAYVNKVSNIAEIVQNLIETTQSSNGKILEVNDKYPYFFVDNQDGNRICIVDAHGNTIVIWSSDNGWNDTAFPDGYVVVAEKGFFVIRLYGEGWNGIVLGSGLS